jgi:hypothetical protein
MSEQWVIRNKNTGYCLADFSRGQCTRTGSPYYSIKWVDNATEAKRFNNASDIVCYLLNQSGLARGYEEGLVPFEVVPYD